MPLEKTRSEGEQASVLIVCRDPLLSLALVMQFETFGAPCDVRYDKESAIQ